MSFKDLGLLSAFADRCERLGYVEPTPIQKQAIPVVLEGGDVIACAETGTGKTAAFLLPILNRQVQFIHKKGLRVLILSPTRELTKQIQALKQGVNILIATPGRLMDFMEQGMINFKDLDTLVLDEADRMLDMG